MDFKPGDVVVTKPYLMWEGMDVGEHLGKVVSTSGHIVVELYDFPDSRVKCFRYEIEAVSTTDDEDELELTDEDIAEFFDDIDSSLP